MSENQPEEPVHVIRRDGEEIHCLVDMPAAWIPREDGLRHRLPLVPLIQEDARKDPVPVFEHLISKIQRTAADIAVRYIASHQGEFNRFLYATLERAESGNPSRLRLHAVRPCRPVTFTPYDFDDYLVSGWSPPTYLCAERTGLAGLEVTFNRHVGNPDGFDRLFAVIYYLDAWLFECADPRPDFLEIIGDEFLSAWLSAVGPDCKSQLLLALENGEKPPMHHYYVEE